MIIRLKDSGVMMVMNGVVNVHRMENLLSDWLAILAENYIKCK